MEVMGVESEPVMCKAARRASGLARGFTLAETMVSVGVFAVLASAMGGAIVVASRAIPDPGSTTVPRLEAGSVVDQICGDLRYAVSIVSRSETHVEFTVADRDADGDDEVIRYEWEGNDGPVSRTHDGVSGVILAAARDFIIEYRDDSHTTTQTVASEADSGEVLLSAFSGWSGVTPTLTQAPINASAWASQYFKIDRVTLPANITQFSITKVRLKVKRVTVPVGLWMSVAIHSPASVGGPAPASAALGTPQQHTVLLLPTAFSSSFTDSYFTDVVFTTPSTEFCIVVKGSSTGEAQLQYYISTSAPTDTPVFLWSSTSGTSWLPTENKQQNDAPYEVWGRYRVPVTAQQESTTYTLRAVRVSVQTPDKNTVSTDVITLNQPTVTP